MGVKKDYSTYPGALLHLFGHREINGLLMARTYARRPWVCVVVDENPDRRRWREATSVEEKLYYQNHIEDGI